MNSHRRFSAYLVALVVGTFALVATLPLVGAASVTNPSTNTVLIATKAALSKQTGVHLLVTSKSGSTSTRVTADIGKSSGTETIQSGKDDVTILVTPANAYLGGNSAGLTSIIGLTAAEQKKVGTDWIVMKEGTTPYKDLKSSVTITVLDGMLPAIKGTAYSTTNSKNTKYYQLTWTTNATSSSPKTKSVFTISTAKSTLPIQETVTASSGKGTTTFSKWGEHINIDVPAISSTIAYSKVVG